MVRMASTLVLAAALVSAPVQMPAQAAVDPEVARGIGLVDEGDYDAAILALDAAARRLASVPSKANDLSQAFLYLGIAYMGKGHEAAAKAKFREAMAQIKDMTLSPDRFPPKVINAFEAAKAEAGPAGGPTPAGAATAATEKKKGGGGKKILIIGGLGAAAAGVAVAAGGGGGGGGSGTTTPQSDTRSRMEFSGSLGPQDIRGQQIVVTRAGTLEARLTWQDGQLELTLGCQEHEPPYTGCGTYNRTTNTSGTLTAPVTQKTYDILVQNFSSKATPETYTLVVLFP